MTFYNRLSQEDIENKKRDWIEKLSSPKTISRILFYIGCESMPEEGLDLIRSFCYVDNFHVDAVYPEKKDINIIIENIDLFMGTLFDVVYEGEYDDYQEILNEEAEEAEEAEE